MSNTKPILTDEEVNAFEVVLSSSQECVTDNAHLDVVERYKKRNDEVRKAIIIARAVIDRLKAESKSEDIRCANCGNTIRTASQVEELGTVSFLNEQGARYGYDDRPFCSAECEDAAADSAKLPHEMHPPESFAKKQIDTAEADKIIDEALNRVKVHGCHDPYTSRVYEEALRALRSRLVLPAPRRLQQDEADVLASTAYNITWRGEDPDNDGHTIAAVVCKMLGMKYPES